MNYLKAILIALPVLVTLDLAWIGWIMKGFYQGRLQDLLRFASDGTLAPRIVPVLLTYVCMILLVVLFAVPRGVEHGAWHGFLTGALLGILVYGLYNFTNLALFEKYDTVLSIIDTLWGGVIFGIATLVVVWFL